MMKVPNLSCFVMGTPVLERLILGMDCGYPQRMWARLNSGNNSSIVTDRLCGQIGVGDVASACVYRTFTLRMDIRDIVTGALLKHVVNVSELVPDEVQRAIENSKGG